MEKTQGFLLVYGSVRFLQEHVLLVNGEQKTQGFNVLVGLFLSGTKIGTWLPSFTHSIYQIIRKKKGEYKIY